jgi:glycosyltransferase involved in cell wall biosynthesis
MPSKNTMAVIVALPPPIHGSSVMNQLVLDTIKKLEGLEVRHIGFSFSTAVSDIGSMGLLKILKQIAQLVKIFSSVARVRPRVSYLAPAVAEMGAIRDGVLVLLVKCVSPEVIVHLHGRGLSNAKLGWAAKAFFKLVYSGTHAIHLSEGLAESIRGVANWRSVTSIPNGVVDSEHNRVKNAESDATKRLLFLSNFIETKGIGDFLELCCRLKMSGVDYQASVIGAASLELSLDDLRLQLVEKELEGHVDLIGPCYGATKDEIIAKSDVFVFPSYYPNECCPLVVLEAMAAGLPVVAYEIGAVPEMVESGVSGFVTEPRDLAGLHSHVVELLTESNRLDEMSDAARTRYEEFFTREKFKERITNYFRRFESSDLKSSSALIKD